MSFRNQKLLRAVRRAFLKLGLNPSRIFDRRIVLTRQSNILRYFQQIGTGNENHLLVYGGFLRRRPG